MPSKNPIDVDRTLDRINSKKPLVRSSGWRELHERCAEFRPELSRSQLIFLHDAERMEDMPQVRSVATEALLALALLGGIPSSPSKTPRRDELEDVLRLADWFFEPFRQHSVVLGVTATHFRRRDEGALLWLGRRLSFAEFGETKFRQVALEHPDLDSEFFGHSYQAFCLVGRLGLFGEKTLKLLSTDGLRFGFDVPTRPKGLRQGDFDPKYHRIREQIGNAQPVFHSTDDKDGFRTDFAVVQRYCVKLGTRRVIVVIVAGASSLGTLAAAQWSARDFFRPTDPLDNRPIERPPDIAPNSRLEALLYARAKETTRAWEHPEIQLRQLWVDNASWSLTDREWRAAPIQVITVVREKGEPVQILFDGQPSKLTQGRQMFRLMVAIVEQVKQRTDGRVNTAELAENDAIWNEPGPSENRVRSQLRLLRTRYLRESLNTRGTVRLCAKVKEVNNP